MIDVEAITSDEGQLVTFNVKGDPESATKSLTPLELWKVYNNVCESEKVAITLDSRTEL